MNASNRPDNRPNNMRKPDYLTPVLPGKKNIGPLKDLSQEIVAASSGLEGRIARETAEAIGDQLRLINSYYSNLIEGHKTTIPDIESAMQNRFDPDPDKKYAQELCAAHVAAEKRLMREISNQDELNVSSPGFISDIHRVFYDSLPEEHCFTHTPEGFSDIPVQPGIFRDLNVSVDGQSIHGPDFEILPGLMDTFAGLYDSNRFHGDERLIAMAASHHRLTWLHPFRDGNGRVTRLFSGLYLYKMNVNTSNLWSLSRGLSRQKEQYMFELWATDSPNNDQSAHFFDDDLLADFCEFIFRTCLDQIHFMKTLLRIDEIEARIDWFVESRGKNTTHPLNPESSKLLKAVFTRGFMPRGRAGEILNMSERSARRVVSALIGEGLLVSKSHRAPLTIGLPTHALPYYFPDLYDPSMLGDIP